MFKMIYNFTFIEAWLLQVKEDDTQLMTQAYAEEKNSDCY